MRALAFALMSLLASSELLAHAATIPKLSVCPTSDFLLVYDDTARVDLGAEQIEVVDAAVARMQQCDIQSIEVFSNSTVPEQQLWRRRVEVVRDALIARGIDEEVIDLNTAATAELPTRWDSSRGEGVVVFIRFR